MYAIKLQSNLDNFDMKDLYERAASKLHMLQVTQLNNLWNTLWKTPFSILFCIYRIRNEKMDSRKCKQNKRDK
jgi:hypothetical protein